MNFLLNWVIVRFQPLIFRGCFGFEQQKKQRNKKSREGPTGRKKRLDGKKNGAPVGFSGERRLREIDQVPWPIRNPCQQ